MRRLARILTTLMATAFIGLTGVKAQGVDPQAYYVDEKGFDQISRNIPDGQAPLDVTFRSNPTNMDGYSPSYEWHFRKLEPNEGFRELFVRYEEDTQFTFKESGTFNIVQKTRLEQDGTELDSVTIVISIAESKLEFPNALSPNDDGRNDVLKAKEGWKSIVSFHAIIVNRWGQKLYEWFDPAGEWDGKYKGRVVKDGVYYLQVIAKGADGKEYHIRKDINLISGFTEGGTNSGTEQP